jgi:hypothetical protein
MSSNLHVTVDTEPMAESVHRVTNHVNGTITAIVAMQAATIAAEQKAANHICDKVNHGFHSLLLSQVSQKSAKAKSIVDAKLQELVHLESSLRRVRDQMERDFHRIAGRYRKIFVNLNKSLRARICELDKAPTDLAVHQMPQAERRMLSSGVQIPIHQKESLSSAQFIVSSVARKNTLKAIGHMQGMLEKSDTLQDSMARIMDTEPAESITSVMIPAILFEADDLNLQISDKGISLPIKSSKIEVALREAFNTLTWDPSSTFTDSIREQVRSSVAHTELPDRVRLKVIELLDSSQWQQAQGGGI